MCYHAVMSPHKIVPVEERFWKYVNKTDGCWEWTGARFVAGGYGALNGGRRGVTLRAHRLSWEIHHGPIPAGMDICHKCDNPPCVNPAHLFPGTTTQNMRDCSGKGRARGGSPGGERHHQAKLTDVKVLAIRTEYAAGGVGLQPLADRYGVSKKTILNVVHRRVWKHV